MPSTSTPLKELIRHLITSVGLARVWVRLRTMAGKNVGHLLEPTLAGRFAAIYRNRVWLNDRREGSLSGEGSDLGTTGHLTGALPALLAANGIASLLDLGCGDFNWMRSVPLPCRYTGADIVPDVIAANIREYGSEERCFLILDATRDPLPQADAVLCREVLFHLSFDDAWRVIENVRTSGARYLIATNDANLNFNADILSGDFRILNLLKPPFAFPPPVEAIPDNGVSANRVLALWRVSELPRKRES